MHKKCANAGRITLRVKLAVFLGPPVVPSEERIALAPASTTDDLPVTLDHNIRAISDELSIYSEHRARSCLYLYRRIVSSLEGSRRKRNDTHTPPSRSLKAHFSKLFPKIVVK
jgi:hypothetical protein